MGFRFGNISTYKKRLLITETTKEKNKTLLLWKVIGFIKY